MCLRDGRLTVAGRDAEALAREHGTPLYAYDLTRIGEVVRALRGALTGAGLRPRVRLALKAQRAPEALRFLRRLGPPGDPGAVGIDACSPGEVLHALEHGWRAEEISFTGTNLSDRDLDVLLPLGVHLNLDLLSQLDRVGRRAPGRAVGLRVNPRAGIMRGHEHSLYASPRPTKFGIYEEDLDAALAVAARHDLAIDTVHVHLANGVLTPELPALDHAFGELERLARRLLHAGCPITEINVGGGLGTPLHPGEEPLDLDAYATVIADRFRDLDVAIGVEPGEFLTNESGMLLTEVVTVEDRMGARFVGLDAGWNVMNDHFIYQRTLRPVLCRAGDAEPTGPATFTGHINEGNDVFVEDAPFPDVDEGDIVALVSIGGYAQAMYTTHCMRPPAASVFFDDRL